MDISGVFSVLVVLALMGVVFSQTLRLIRRRVLFWAPSERERAS